MGLLVDALYTRGRTCSTHAAALIVLKIADICDILIADRHLIADSCDILCSRAKFLAKFELNLGHGKALYQED